jgi:4-carboxymuconolactone decarboxylase
MTDDERQRLGRQTLAAIHGPVGLGYVDRLAEVAPEFADLLVGFPYGELYARQGLDLRSRQIATIAALTVLGDSEHELTIHVRSAMRAGLSKQEILEVLLQMTAYAGFPRALSALKAAAKAFAEADGDARPEVMTDPSAG